MQLAAQLQAPCHTYCAWAALVSKRSAGLLACAQAVCISSLEGASGKTDVPIYAILAWTAGGTMALSRWCWAWA